MIRWLNNKMINHALYAHIIRRSINSLVCFVALAFLVTLMPAPVQAQGAEENLPGVISLAEYAEQLTMTSAHLAEAAAGNLAAYDQARDALLAIQGVQLADQEIVYPPPLLANRDEIDPAAMQAYVTAASARVELVRNQLTAAAGDNSAVRLALLQQVLARAEFSQQESILQRFQRWLGELWSRLFPTVGGQAARGVARLGPLVFWTLVAVGGLALILMLSYWLQGVLGRMVGDAEARRQAADGADAPMTAQEARDQAARLAQDGSYRQAVRQLYLSALLTLDERGVIQYDRSLTNREVLSQVQREEQVESHLQPVVETFDRVWYGEQEPDRETFDLYAQEIKELSTAEEKARNRE